MSNRNAEFLAIVPPGWRPAGVFTMPREILGGEFICRRTTLHNALTVARKYNLGHPPSKGGFEGRWAVVVKGLNRAGRFHAPRSRRGNGVLALAAATSGKQ